MAGSRLTAQVMPQNLIDALKPEYVSPVVAYLCSEQCEETGMIFSVGGGYFSRVAYVEGEGVFLGTDKELSAEDIRANIDKIKDLSKGIEITQAMDQSGKILKLMNITP